jgi:hypothetical protein
MDDADATRDDVLVLLSSNIAANVEIGGYGVIRMLGLVIG